MAKWTAPIDAYCERTDPSLWSEPLNAISNLAFLIAAALAWQDWRRAGGRDLAALVLIAIAAAVGIGSFLFHTFANRWSALADVLPIAALIYAYFFLAIRRFLGLSLPAALAASAAFLSFNMGLTPLWRMAFGPEAVAVTNGSLGYLPAALALLVVGMTLRLRTAAGRPGSGTAAPGTLRDTGNSLLVAAGVFTVSLTFRTVDQTLCGALPFGTHFLWHILNGVVLHRLMVAAVEHRVGSDQGSASTRLATARTSSGNTSKA